jgi:8-oxo-dGTP diphosphatase
MDEFLMQSKLIKKIDVSHEDITKFKAFFVGCIVLTNADKILLQQRGVNWKSFPGFLSEFGGRIELNETPIHALARELKEELGAKVIEEDVVSLGAITEKATNYSELIYTYFWHDKLGTVSQCFEGEPKYFDNVNSVLIYPKVMDSVRWMLNECKNRNYLK